MIAIFFIYPQLADDLKFIFAPVFDYFTKVYCRGDHFFSLEIRVFLEVFGGLQKHPV